MECSSGKKNAEADLFRTLGTNDSRLSSRLSRVAGKNLIFQEGNDSAWATTRARSDNRDRP